VAGVVGLAKSQRIDLNGFLEKLHCERTIDLPVSFDRKALLQQLFRALATG